MKKKKTTKRSHPSFDSAAPMSKVKINHTSVPAGDSNSDAGTGSNCAKYKRMSPAKLPISRSPCVSIPSGLSSTSFIESPVLLSNMKAEPSPTTGSVSKVHLTHGSDYDSLDERLIICFEFNPHSGCNSISRLSSAGTVLSSGMNHLQSEALERGRNQFQSQLFGSLSSMKSEIESTRKELNPSAAVQMTASGDDGVRSDHKDVGPSVTAERSLDDGYNWRKYGQKLVKGSEFPRSYYKCTHPNCEVKKFFERSHDGHISEIFYKGTHDHPKPQPTRRFANGAVISVQEKSEKISSLIAREDNSSFKVQLSHNLEPNDTPELSPRGVNDDCMEGAVSQLNCMNDAVDEDDPFSKRRKIDGDGGLDVTAVIKPIREPRVVVQTTSEVDILDDGYRWRKYGQKVVRGNPNPRSYYKCTNAGCPVRKHVERASHDHKAVITAYEGKHNHDVPTAKPSSHDMVAPTSMNGLSMIRSGMVSDLISLDLGVGIISGTDNKYSEERQKLDTEALQRQIQFSTSSSLKVAQVTPVLRYYGGNMYRYRENRVEGHSFETPFLNCSSIPHP